MPEKILIVEDELLVAKDLRMMLEEAHYHVCGIARSVAQATELLERETPDIVLLDIFLKGAATGIDLAVTLNEKNIPFIYLSANSNRGTIEAVKRTKPYGFMVKPFREKEVLIALEIARYRHQNSIEADLQKELLLRDRLKKIQSGQAAAAERLLALTEAIQPFISFDLIEFILLQDGKHAASWTSFLRITYNEYQQIGRKELLTISAVKEADLHVMEQESASESAIVYYNGMDFGMHMTVHPRKKLFAGTFGFHSHAMLPLNTEDATCLIYFYSKSPEGYDNKTMHFLSRMQQLLAPLATVALLSMFSKTHVSAPQPAPDRPRQTELRDIFRDIIGRSKPILAVMDFVKQVSAVDTTVLILGETGTGKEKIAEHIHRLSPRREKPLISINCAAIPEGLIESELFGHEKGAFTSATDKRTGKFEQADGGTIFLDEIGDVPHDVQVKLLRVLQQREIERIGGRETIKVDVRVITATNKILENEVAEGRFRMDLYYRLNVFPILVPPLRKRKEDIPLLTDYFLKIYSERHNISACGITQDAMEALMRYDWPGNIRELENTIERSLVLNDGEIIKNVFLQPGFMTDKPLRKQHDVKTIDEVEKEHIQIVLTRCKNKVYGPGGAAEMLNIPPTTLMSKMKKLGISKKL
ncbi:sigma 54-interacting response regulator [Chitinophaga sp. CF418]|uniref:sigma 54-interacting response regulator n=1 Tax=Chitinophaga sp. CF418 TaxID=1855287 RepID=UPI000913A677|nr:sigma 54-interacting response regulator [Chitinophaga sp. CF418]SHN35857.1 regulatory protein, Fis family [Chitinophaga sp. CF418]